MLALTAHLQPLTVYCKLNIILYFTSVLSLNVQYYPKFTFQVMTKVHPVVLLLLPHFQKVYAKRFYENLSFVTSPRAQIFLPGWR